MKKKVFLPIADVVQRTPKKNQKKNNQKKQITKNLKHFFSFSILWLIKKCKNAQIIKNETFGQLESDYQKVFCLKCIIFHA